MLTFRALLTATIEDVAKDDVSTAENRRGEGLGIGKGAHRMKSDAYSSSGGDQA